MVQLPFAPDHIVKPPYTRGSSNRRNFFTRYRLGSRIDAALLAKKVRELANTTIVLG